MFGKLVRESRECLGISQEEAAKSIEQKYHVRISPSYLSMIENGTKTNMTVNLVNALLDFFSLPKSSTSSLFDNKYSDNRVEITAVHRSDNSRSDLPEEAIKEIENFEEFIKNKYKDYYKKHGKE